MSEHTDADYSELVSKHKDPIVGGKKVPYHLWGRITPQRGAEPGPDLCEMRMVGSHIYPEKVEFCLNQGWKLVKYYIPEGEHRETRTLLEMALKGGKVDDLLAQIKELQEKNDVLNKKVKEK